MKNKLTDLNNYLFEQLERINDDDLTSEQLNEAIRKANTISKISETIIKNSELQLKAVNLAAEYGVINNTQVKLLLSDLKEKEENA
jgi:hypothetical protein